MEGSPPAAPPATPPATPPPATPPTPPPATPPPSQPTPPPAGESAAEKRIRELNDAKKKAEDEAAALRAEKEQREREQMSELDRVKAERDEFKTRAETAEGRLQGVTRKGWIEKAAKAAGAAHPDDVADILGTREGLDSEEAVQTAVNELKEQREHLFPGETPPPPVVPPGFGSLGGSPPPPPAAPGAPPAVPPGQPLTPEQAKEGIGRDIAGILLGNRGRPRGGGGQ